MTGLAKEYVVPGWRVGWVTIHDAPIKTQGNSEIQLNINDQVLTSLQGYDNTLLHSSTLSFPLTLSTSLL